jgi:hypothetical protein
MKICVKCKKEKPLEDFYNDKTRNDGKNPYCIVCRKNETVSMKKEISDKKKVYYKLKKNQIRDNKKIYYEENKEKILAAKRIFNDKNKEYRLKYFEDNKDKIKTTLKRCNSSPVDYKFSEQLSFAEETRSNEGLLEVLCAYCGRWILPTRNQVRSRIKSINGKSKGENRFYCSASCKQACPIYKTRIYYKGQKVNGSSREIQPELRQMAMLRDDYTCQKCGKGGDCVPLHCHHIKAVADDPIESADLDNVITLCKDCHKAVHKIEGCGKHEVGKC